MFDQSGRISYWDSHSFYRSLLLKASGIKEFQKHEMTQAQCEDYHQLSKENVTPQGHC